MLKKSILLISSTSIIGMPIITSISCSSSHNEYKIMGFKIDINKLKKELEDINLFNKLPNDLEKLKKVITTSWVDSWTYEALEKQLMTIMLKQENKNNYLEINLKVKDNNKYYSYRLPNGELTQKWYF